MKTPLVALLGLAIVSAACVSDEPSTPDSFDAETEPAPPAGAEPGPGELVPDDTSVDDPGVDEPGADDVSDRRWRTRVHLEVLVGDEVVVELETGNSYSYESWDELPPYEIFVDIDTNSEHDDFELPLGTDAFYAVGVHEVVFDSAEPNWAEFSALLSDDVEDEIWVIELFPDDGGWTAASTSDAGLQGLDISAIRLVIDVTEETDW